MLVHFDALVVRVALAWEETGDADRHPVEKLYAETFLALTLPVDAVRMGVAKLARCPRDACLPKPPLFCYLFWAVTSVRKVVLYKG